MDTIPTRHRLDRGDFFWLAYLAFYFVEPVLRRSLPYWLECLGIAVVFVLLYIALFRFRRFEIRIACLIGMFLLGVLSYPTNSGAMTFFIYTAALLPFVVTSTTTILLCFVLESMLVVAEGWLLHLNPYNSVFA